MILSKSEIRSLIHQSPPLIEGFIDIEQQLQPNGFDITVREVSLFQDAGQIGVSNASRRLPMVAPLVFNGLGYMELMAGPYLITFNEIVNLPGDLMALARPRSSLLRCGVAVHNAAWDAGYSGRSQALMVVYNPRGFALEKNSRIVQLVFFRLKQETEGYQGVYQRENINPTP